MSRDAPRYYKHRKTRAQGHAAYRRGRAMITAAIDTGWSDKCRQGRHAQCGRCGCDCHAPRPADAGAAGGLPEREFYTAESI
jgi:hypothetical protein